MNKKHLAIRYLLTMAFACCFLQQNLAAQHAAVTYKVRTNHITHYGGSASMVCNDTGPGDAEEYTSYRRSYDDVDDTPVSSGCQTCTTTASSCTVSDNIALAERTNLATRFYFNWEAWEDDRGDRCAYDGPDNNPFTNDDDCYFNLT
ncbi:MAG: hypothetical protein J5I98_13440, partial [Phaeodactylibacter sp.]|nr:hypothetical protein [Phaeodactylibacter sp.]